MRWERDEEPRVGAPGPGAPAPGGSRIYITLAVVLILVLGAIAFFALRGKESGTVGIGSILIGEEVAPFAVPEASSDLDGDANVDPESACSIEVEGAIRVCDFFDKPLVMSWWFTKGVSGCDDQQDVFDELYGKYKGRVGLLSMNVRDDRDKVRGLIAEHGWKVPVGYDRDGAVSNIYRVGVCPTFLFIKPGGILKNAEIGTKTLPELDTQVRSLLKASNGSEIKANNPQQ